MKAVSRFEANLLSVLRFFLRKAPAAQALPLIAKPFDAPPCLSRDAVNLVQDTLAKGIMLLLAQAHGWRRERYLRDGRPVRGRLWERTSPEALGLAFSRHSLRFLIWVTASEMPTKPKTQPRAEDLQIGDWVFFYYVFSALRSVPLGDGLAKLTPFVRNPLCRLAFPGDFSEAPADTIPDFAPWTSGAAVGILEALQGELHDAWLQLERNKPRQLAWRVLRSTGQAQEAVLDAYLTAIDRAGRRDLARFVLHVAAELLGRDENPFLWMEELDLRRERLADRVETYRAILTLPCQLERLRGWTEQARTVGYFDEGYAAAQFWKAEWEFHGDAEPWKRTGDPVVTALLELADRAGSSAALENEADEDEENEPTEEPMSQAGSASAEEPATQANVGRGEEIFRRAQEIVRRWEQWR